MVRLFYQVFAALALISGSAADIECIMEDIPFGGAGGEEFRDDVKRNTNTTGIVLQSAQRIDAIGIMVNGTEWKLHGGSGGTKKQFDLEGKKITEMEVHRAKNSGNVKVVFVKFTVDDGPSFHLGSKNEGRAVENTRRFKAPVEGAYLIGFVGKAAAEVDSLGGIWLDPECAKAKQRKSDGPFIFDDPFIFDNPFVSNDDDDDDAGL